jgi:hypothetical protein
VTPLIFFSASAPAWIVTIDHSETMILSFHQFVILRRQPGYKALLGIKITPCGQGGARIFPLQVPECSLPDRRGGMDAAGEKQLNLLAYGFIG